MRCTKIIIIVIEISTKVCLCVILSSKKKGAHKNKETARPGKQRWVEFREFSTSLIYTAFPSSQRLSGGEAAATARESDLLAIPVPHPMTPGEERWLTLSPFCIKYFQSQFLQALLWTFTDWGLWVLTFLPHSFGYLRSGCAAMMANVNCHPDHV